MRVSVNRRLQINMGHYESYSFGANVELAHGDVGVSDEALESMTDDDREALWARLVEAADDRLAELLTDEIRSTSQLTAEKESFLLRRRRRKTTTNGTKRKARNG